jgi:hypothetical protein
MTNAVQILIERLKTHPDDFFGEVGNSRSLAQWGSPKFAGIERHLNALVGGRAVVEKHMQESHPYWFLEPEELSALTAAYKEAARARFDAEIVHTLLAPEPEPVQYREGMRIDTSGTLNIGTASIANQLAVTGFQARANGSSK